MNIIKDLHDNAIKITGTSALQHSIFRYWIDHTNGYEGCLGFDTETTSLTFNTPSVLQIKPNLRILMRDVTVFGISLAAPYKNKMALIWGRVGTALYEECVKLLQIRMYKVAHNLRYDYRALKNSGVCVAQIMDCTLTMARLHWNRRMKVALNKLVPFICPELSDWEDELKRVMKNIRSSYTRAGYPKNYANYSFIPDEIISPYAMTDGFLCYIINYLIRPQIKLNHSLVYARERAVLFQIVRVEERGMAYDVRRSKKEEKILTGVQKKLRRSLVHQVNEEFNPDSPAQLLEILLQKVKIPKESLMLKGKLTTEKNTLIKVQETTKNKRVKRFVDTILNYRSNAKLVNTYLAPLRQRALINNNIVHCNINPTDTRTGRMTATDPNLENIPRPGSGYSEYNPVRACFTCRAGYEYYFLDYKQMEMWMFAIQAGEKRMLKALQSGKDIHAQTAIDVEGRAVYDKDNKVIYAKRQKYKHVNFAAIYGMGVPGFVQKFQIPEEIAEELFTRYHATYPRLRAWSIELAEQLRVKGYVLDIFGKRYDLHVHEAWKAINVIVQGSCAQILKIGFLRNSMYLNNYEVPQHEIRRPYILVPQHDEFIFEIPKWITRHATVRNALIGQLKENMECIPELMRMGYRLGVDIKRSTTNWEGKKEWLLTN